MAKSKYKTGAKNPPPGKSKRKASRGAGTKRAGSKRGRGRFSAGGR